MYYRGKTSITNNEKVVIQLADYVDSLAYEFTVQITGIYNGKTQIFNVSEVVNNQFTVYGENGSFFWIVYGKRKEIETEPLKSNVKVEGSGPYRWID